MSITGEDDKMSKISAITVEGGTNDAEALQRQQQDIINKKLAGGKCWPTVWRPIWNTNK